MKKRLGIVFILLLSTLLSANILKEYYHSNYGPVERIVFVFSEYPRYRIRDDILSLNISFLETQKLPSVKTKRILKNPVISKITFVPTDAFIGVLINTYEDYTSEEFIIKSGDDYKLVIDMFRHKNPVSVDEALRYADFYRQVNKSHRALYFEAYADSLQRAARINPPRPRPVEKVTAQPEIEEEPEDTVFAGTTIEPVVEEVKDPEPRGEIQEEAAVVSQSESRVKEILLDIYHDKILMFSIAFVLFVIILMLILSIIRQFKKKNKKVEVEQEEDFGSLEFQRVTIKRLLSNGWQISEIARELNLSSQQVEELGRGPK